MTTDLWMLLAAAALHWGLILAAATPNILRNGVGWAFGNRDDAPDPPKWVARTKRASANLLENLPLFTILVLTAHVSNTADELSAIGAMTFVGGRVAHAIVYMGGIPGVRTLCWTVSVVGLGIIAWAIVA